MAFIVTAGVLGLLVGSFLNVVIYRLPIMMDREERAWHRALTTQLDAAGAMPEPAPESPFDLIRPGSACPQCGAPVRWHQNLPILSYLLLRGRCAGCGVSIPIRYPVVEALTGIASALVAWRFGFSMAGAGGLILTWSLIALTGIDLDRQLLPDRITLPLLWLGLGFSLLSGADGGVVFTDPRSAIIGGLAGYLSLWSVYQGFRLVTGKEGMGYGDFKLLAAIGAWLGWQLLPIVILLSAVVGLAAALIMVVFRGHNREVPIPFGPYLAVAGFIALLWGPALLAVWLGTAGG